MVMQIKLLVVAVVAVVVELGQVQFACLWPFLHSEFSGILGVHEY